MNITLSVDQQIVERARERASVMGKSLNQAVRDYLQHLAGDDDIEREIEFFVQTSGQGNPEPGWKWNRDEIYEERIKWPRK